MQTTQQVPVNIPNWHMTSDYVETCNCHHGCPCNFDGFPTYGFCRALVLYSIREGNYGDTRLDGLKVVYAASWPKAIHQGDGTLQLYISKEADAKQRDALVKICSGQAKGGGPFAVFASKMKFVLEPQFVDVNAKIDGRNSSFSVPGVLDVALEPFRSPVTGEEQDVRVQIPKGFIWTLAYGAKTRVMKILSPSLNFDESGKNAFFADVEYKGP